MNFNYFTYRHDDVACASCGWIGKGRELQFGDVSETHSIFDLECPKCAAHLGFVQAPLREEVEAWKRDHPEWTDE